MVCRRSSRPSRLRLGIIIVEMRRLHLLLWWCAPALLAGCGYHQVGSIAPAAPNVRTLAVPIFQSRVQAFRTETYFTQAVVQELNTRTRYRVLTNSGDGTFEGAGADADATLRGTILTETVAPLTYDPASGQTSSYLITVTAQVVLTATMRLPGASSTSPRKI